MIQNLIFGVYLLILDFLAGVLKSAKTSRKVHSFYNTVSFKKPNLLHEPQLTQHFKKYTFGTRPKTLLALNIFPASMFLVGFRKNICTAPLLDAQELHS